MNDQTVKADAGKPRLSLVPVQIVYDIAEVREYGTKKYGDPNNWKRVEFERYVDAMLRHIMEFVRDPWSVDKESGIEHYKHAECNWSFISEMLHERKTNTSREKERTRWIEHKNVYGKTIGFRCAKCGHQVKEEKNYCPECGCDYVLSLSLRGGGGGNGVNASKEQKKWGNITGQSANTRKRENTEESARSAERKPH